MGDTYTCVADTQRIILYMGDANIVMEKISPVLTNEAGGARLESLAALRSAVGRVIRGKDEVVELSITCLLAEGHLLLDDVPGVGKTSLARSLAAALGLQWQRIQFTPDVLPSDITGVSIYHQATSTFEFHPGPVFTSVVLADEINRASPRTQSALLEAMEERNVTVDGMTRPLPSPFMVIATQNPVDMAGTYPLPEAQLDRFLMRCSLGYPDQKHEVEILGNHHSGVTVADIESVLTSDQLGTMMIEVEGVQVNPGILDYIVRLVAWTRTAPGVLLGASPRGSVGLLRAVRARAYMQGRSYVLPGDVQALAVPVLAHRIQLDLDGESSSQTGESVVLSAIENVHAPQPA